MKKHQKNIYIHFFISLLLGIIVWIFFAVYYRHHLHYHEQLQLFLFTSDYFFENLFQPGGLAIYLGRFITQFFYHSSLGAFLLALLLVGLRDQVLTISFKIAKKPIYQLLTCIPSLLFVILLCSEDMMISGLIALLFSLGLVIIHSIILSNKIRIIYLLILIPVLYWLVGFAFIVFPALCLFMEWTKEKKIKNNLLIAITILSLLLTIISPLIAKNFLELQYPINRLWLAGDYYRLTAFFPPAIFYVILSAVIIPVVFKWIPITKSIKRSILIQIVQCLIILLIIDWIVAVEANWKKEELMGYDYYVRTKKWTNIIAKANKRSPYSPQTVSALNLALSRKNYLNDYMFHYYQNGSDGLIPNKAVDYIIPLMIGEIYYYLGLINSAQRFTFEGMESIPDYQKSVRCIQRLAETNLINKQYDVSEKYLKILQKTLFYKDWADNTITYLHDEQRINNHHEWGEIRKYNLPDDYIYIKEDNEILLKALFDYNNDNKMALEYLLALNLLNKDLNAFKKNLEASINKLELKKLPVIYQQAIIYMQSLIEVKDSLSNYVDNDIAEQFISFQKAYIEQPTNEAFLRKNYGNTYWYYLYFRGNTSAAFPNKGIKH